MAAFKGLFGGSPAPGHRAARRGPPGTASGLVEVARFGTNPGALKMLLYVPRELAESPPLVVVLHGCGQAAEAYAEGAGWLALAERHGFAVLCPEQNGANNPQRCFNWFQPDDVSRDRGEVASIRQMIEHAVLAHGLDRTRVFVTGLSAGGAMASAMLAAYPEVFAGGAIVAGLPYGAASSVQEAMQAMFQSPRRPAREWGDRVRAASAHDGPWPRISIWHGDADTTVVPANAAQSALQWADVHGLSPSPTTTEVAPGLRRQLWTDEGGRPVIESMTVQGMGHGTPLAAEGDGGYGRAGPFLLETGISSSALICDFWGVAGGPDEARRAPAAASDPAARPAAASSPGAANPARPSRGRPGFRLPPLVDGALAQPSKDVGRVISDALRAAGLMR